jgi:cytochrome b subunit of formate dehydrogenase
VVDFLLGWHREHASFPPLLRSCHGGKLYLLQDLLYYFRIRDTKPRYDRFTYQEKFDYWAIFWGVPIMGGTGLILWFPVLASRLLPSWIVPLSLEIHSDEALLAVGWIVMVHWFFALRSLLSRPVFPLNSAMFSGTVPVERYRHEHPLEYERISPETEAGQG